MTKSLITALLLILSLSGSHGAGDANCHRYSAEHLNPTLCTESMRQNDHKDFKDFYTLFNDAHQNENAQDFIVHSLTWMYRYIHCASDIEAIATLFYDVDPKHLPHTSSPFWQIAYDYLHVAQSGAPIIGRRKRANDNNFDNDDALLVSKIRNICTQLSPACVQWLIGYFKDTAKNHFVSQNPQFPNPNDYLTTTPPTTTTQKLTTTTTTPSTTTTETSTSTTTTPIPTTSTTTPTTTTTTPSTTPSTTTTETSNSTTTTPIPTTSTTTPTTTVTTTMTSTETSATPSTTTVAPTTTPTTTFGPPITCWQCTGLDCLLGDKSNKCPAGQVCFTSMFEGEHGREIDRGCAVMSTCQAFNNTAACGDAETVELSWHTRCAYCCDKDLCNHPPHIRPDDVNSILHFP